MTSINTSNLDQAIVVFQGLPVEEQLATLGMLFKEISGSIPANTFGTSEESTRLIDQIKGQRQDEQLQTLSDFLANKTAKGDEVALDPHPSKALLELIPGSTQPALTRYESLDANSRLAFWYQLGQQLNDSIPVNSSLSSEATELLTSLRSLGVEQQAAFLRQIA
ncbi:MAG: hypothetical protein KME10_23170 [Plectolyngbya sp. WJT66-NPBG17]|jgi:hypothetical protein|nr:hypothetical protein [Plectolyngbya sp. WJT66-NPBG17]MBW4524483.1 hypothetical protein [Phormidium tanganyikae FI6-MK23]